MSTATATRERTTFDFPRLKAAVDIVDIIGARIQLKKRGTEYVGCCPWHNDSDPSLTVHPKKQVFFCPVCRDKKGDVVDFLLAFGCTFKEAAEVLHGGPLDKPAPAQRVTVKREKPVQWTQEIPPAPATNFAHYRHGEPVRTWEYHTADGRLLGYVCRFEFVEDGKPKKDVIPYIFARNEKTGAKAWRWQAFAQKRPLYNLPRVIDSAVVVLCEGEKTADAIAAHLPSHAVTTWPGGTNATGLADFDVLAGKTVILWPDNDDAGHKAMRAIATELEGFAALKWVHIPREWAKGWDAADTDWQGDELRMFLRANMHDTPPAEEPAAAASARIMPPEEPDEKPAQPVAAPPPPPAPAGPVDVLEENEYFRILGFETDENGATYCFFSKRLNCVLRTSAAGITKNFVAQLAPPAFWNGVGFSTPEHVLQWVVDSAGAKMIFSDAALRGRGAWFDAGRTVLHTGDRLIVDGEPVGLGDLRSDFIYTVGERMAYDTVEPLAKEKTLELLRLLRRVRWERKVNADLLAGWCVVALMCGALPWRPHIWITGSAGTGKSWIFQNIVSRILGNMALRVQGETTEAGIRQTLGHDAMPVIFDESEAEDKKGVERLQSILTLMRGSSTSDGGMTIKGSAGGSSNSYRIRSCFAFASIGVPVSQQSDRSRISILTMTAPGLPLEEWEKLAAQFLTLLDDDFISALRARTVRMIPTIIANAKTFSKACAVVLGSQRAGDQAGTLLAGFCALRTDDVVSYDDALEYVAGQDWREEKGHDTTRDEIRLFALLMEHLTRVGTDERTVGELIALVSGRATHSDFVTADVAARRLAQLGIKVDDDRLLISNSVDALQRILAGTPWARNHGKILMRLDGAQAVESTRFAASKSRAVSLPLSLLHD